MTLTKQPIAMHPDYDHAKQRAPFCAALTKTGEPCQFHGTQVFAPLFIPICTTHARRLKVLRFLLLRDGTKLAAYGDGVVHIAMEPQP